jgi:hypothetical protein
MKNRIKIKTVYGKILTVNVEEETDEYISGKDKFGAFVKIKKIDIENSIPISEGAEE